MTQTLSEPRNRLVEVIDSKIVNGIDFVELKSVKTLYVHFLNTVKVMPAYSLEIVATISGGDRIQNIQVGTIDENRDWLVDGDGRPVLKLTASEPGDFSTYILTLQAKARIHTLPHPLPRPAHRAPQIVEPLTTLDPMYRSAQFSFKAMCPSEFDCAQPAACEAPDEPPLPAIDYTAKDYQSFKQALSEFSSQRYPGWQERSEADFGMMLLESLSALGDELSYLQDRVAGEASLLNATQRRSLVVMARLVDYEPAPALSSTTTVQCNVTGSVVPAGTPIGANSPDGGAVPFEIGTGLTDTKQYPVSPLWNDGIPPYWFDDGQQCLRAGATSMWILGHGFGFKEQLANGVSLLIQTDLPGESIREVVTLTDATEIWDPIFTTPSGPTPVTYIAWDTALTSDHDLTETHLAGNLLPATQGQRFAESFVIGSPSSGSAVVPAAIARYGPNGTASQPNWIYRYPLSRSSATTGRLSWLPASGPGSSTIAPDMNAPIPEVDVERVAPEPEAFAFTTSLLDATAEEAAVTVDPAAWRVAATNDLGAPCQWEYDGDQGDTLRFGDGVFGVQPNEGDQYLVRYRIGMGSAGNVAADAITKLPAASTAYLTGVRNPFAVTNGADAETTQHIQRMAPQAFRAVQYRAVRAEDYQASAETLPWVLRAGCSFRWTGSWLTVFTAADPAAGNSGGATATLAQQEQLIDLLNRRRLAGYESYAPPPEIVSIDLEISVCVATGWLAGDVEAAVLKRLADAKQADGSEGYFYADSFTFGTPLYRSSLEAAIQGVAGVNGVLDVEYRQRGASNTFQTLPAVLQIGPGQILRVANDANFPERGTIRVFPEGGR